MIHADLSVSHILCWQLDSEREKAVQTRGPGGRFISVAQRQPTIA